MASTCMWLARLLGWKPTTPLWSAKTPSLDMIVLQDEPKGLDLQGQTEPKHRFLQKMADCPRSTPLVKTFIPATEPRTPEGFQKGL